jgi:hypothetical protein
MLLYHLASGGHFQGTFCPSTESVTNSYDQVLKKPLGDMEGFVRAKRPKRLPVVLMREKTVRLFDHLTGVDHLMAGLCSMGPGCV